MNQLTEEIKLLELRCLNLRRALVSVTNVCLELERIVPELKAVRDLAEDQLVKDKCIQERIQERWSA